MSEYFSGVTFAMQRVTPSDDGQLHRAILPDCILDGCAFSYSGSVLSMGAGSLLICGRQIRHTAAQSWSVTGAASGYARLVIAIDLSQSATADVFDQVSAAIQYATAPDGFAALTQSNINAAGTVYQVAACVVSLGTSGITGILDSLSVARNGQAASGKTVASLSQLDSLTSSGSFNLNASGNNAAIYGVDFSKSTVLVEAYDSENVQQTISKLGSRTRARRWRASGIWGAWGIECPPMELSVEYRTTELWGDKPVYTKRLAYTASNIAAQNTLLPHGVNGMDVCISADALWKRTDETPDGWRQLPSSDYSTGDWDGHVEYVDGENIKLRLGSKLQYRMKLSAEPVYVTIRYTRQ
jgi:hypothetical protein